MRGLKILIVMLILLMSVGAVCAAENITGDSMGDDSKEILETVQGDIANDDSVDILKAAQNDIYTAPSDGSFTDLTYEIESKEVLNLTKGYKFNNETDDSKGIVISTDNFVLNGNGYTIDANNQSRIFNITANNVTLSNLILINGNAKDGGAIYSTATLTLNNVTFASNYATEKGGAVALYGNATLNCNDARFIDNYAGAGSSIYVDKGNLNLYNSFVTSSVFSKRGQIVFKKSRINVENTTFINITSSYTPALYVEEGEEIRIINSNFINLMANITAGALAVKGGGYVYIKDCEFINTTSSKNAGAILADIAGDRGLNGSVTVLDTIFRNTYSEFGGAYLQLGGNLLINGTEFANSHGKYNGGAIYLSYTESEINNCTFTSNGVERIEGYPTYGGAIFSDISTLNVDGSMFTNSTAGAGAAIYAYDTSYTIKNSIFEDNTNSIYTFFDRESPILENNVFINDNNISTNNELHNSIKVAQGMQLTLVDGAIDTSTILDKFDLRDYGWVTPVRDQGWMGACWTFGMTSALESALLKATGISADFSENNMQNTMIRYSIYGTPMLYEGGMNTIGASYLLSWLGAFTQDADDYDELGKISPVITTLNDLHVQDVIFIPNNEIPDGTQLKLAIMKYGALDVGYFGQSTYDEENPYYNPVTYAQYVEVTKEANHEVSVVGWDDNYPKENFLITPPGNGAWIIKNSWDTDWGDSGYLYVSYYDKSLATSTKLSDYATAIIIENTEPYNKNYQYDLLWGGSFLPNPSGDNVIYYNQFEALGDDLIAAVGTYFNQSGVNYTVEIYVNDKLKLTQTGVSPYLGYHTIKLNEYIPVSQGDVFRAVVTSNVMPYINVAESRTHYTNNISFSCYDGNTWDDNYDYNVIACLKVYTVAVPTLSDLQEAIANSTGNHLDLYYDYGFSNAADNTSGVLIGRDNFTINGNGHTIDGKSLSRIFNITANNVTINDLILIKGNGDKGGAIYAAESLTLNNVTFISNYASGSGGAVYISNGNLTDCNFVNNTAYFDGGAIHFRDDGAVTNCNFINNQANGDTSFGGGAVYSAYLGTVRNCNFINNQVIGASISVVGGGAVFIDDGEVINCNFTNNQANSGSGSAIHFNNGAVVNCNFVNNSASERGGAVFIDRDGEVTNCNFVNNTANFGGAVYFNYYCNVANCNFANNTAADGGAVYLNDNGTVRNCNFVNNSASGSNAYGGAVYFEGNGEVTNCNFTDNRATGDNGNSIYFNASNGIVDKSTFIYTHVVGTEVYFDDGCEIATVSNSRFENALTDDINTTVYGAYIINCTLNGVLFESDVEVDMYNTTISIEVSDITYGESEIVNVTLLCNGDSMAMANVSIVLYFNGNACGNVNVTTDADGCASFAFSNMAAGTYNVTAFYFGDDQRPTCNASDNFTVSKFEPVMNVDVDTMYGDVIVNITLPVDATGNITVYVGGEEWHVAPIGGTGSISIHNLDAGDYMLTVVYGGDDKYLNETASCTFTVFRAVPMMDVSSPDIDYGEDAVIHVTLPVDATGSVDIRVYDYIYYLIQIADSQSNMTSIVSGLSNSTSIVSDSNLTFYNETFGGLEIVDGKVTLQVPDLKAGAYVVDVTYGGNDKYSAVEALSNFTVSKFEPEMNVSAMNIRYGEALPVSVILPEDATGSLKFTYSKNSSGIKIIVTKNITHNGTVYMVDLIYQLYSDAVGLYDLTVTYSGDDRYLNKSASTTFTVSKAASAIGVEASDIACGDVESIRVVSNVDGSFEVVVRDSRYVAVENATSMLYNRKFNVDVIGGEAVLNVTDLQPGNYTVLVTFNGNANYFKSNASTSFAVYRMDAALNLIVNDIGWGESETVTAAITDGAGGMVTFMLFKNGESLSNVSSAITNGAASYKFSNLAIGLYNVAAVYSGDDRYLPTNMSKTFRVNPSDSFADLQALIISAGDTLTLMQDYYGTGNRITIAKTLTIDGAGHALDANFESGIFNITGTVTLKNIRFKNGVDSCGGAVYATGCVNIIGCEFGDCEAVGNDSCGGAVYLSADNCVVEDSIFKSNRAGDCGGAVYIKGSNNRISGCAFNGNHVSKAIVSVQGGGAICSGGRSLVVEGSNFTGNYANASYGGAIRLNRASTIRDSSFRSNFALVGNSIWCAEGATFSSNSFTLSAGENPDDLIGGTYQKDVLKANDVYNENNVLVSTPKMTLDASDIIFGQTAEVHASLPEDAQGEVTFVLSNASGVVMSGSSDISGGISSFKFFNLTYGVYDVVAQYSGDAKYYDTTCIGEFAVRPLVVISQGVIVGEDANIYMELGNVSDSIIIKMDGRYFDVQDIENGTLNFTFSTAKLTAANHTVSFEYDGIDFDGNIFNYYDEQSRRYLPYKYVMYVAPIPLQMTQDVLGSNNEGVIFVEMPVDAEGTIEIFVNDVKFTVVDVVDGIARIDMSDFKDGDYMVTFQYSGDTKYSSFTKDSVAVVKNNNPASVSSSDMTMVYTSGSVYYATVLTKTGKGISGIMVSFYVDGNYYASATTNVNGVAGITISKAPGTYGITSSANGLGSSRTLKVTHVLSLKKVAVKRSAKKLVLTATLKKVDGKYLKNKKITFKFKGKKYVAKTNKKGVAKLTIKSKVLKKLKAGKKVVYQATYLKDTVKYSVKIKK